MGCQMLYRRAVSLLCKTLVSCGTLFFSPGLNVGSFTEFFWLLSFAQAKESDSPAGEKRNTTKRETRKIVKNPIHLRLKSAVKSKDK